MRGEDGGREKVGMKGRVRDSVPLALAGAGPGIEICYARAEEAFVCVDPVQIQQVLVTLVKNAAEAAQPLARREIAISTSLAEGTVPVRVDDNGHGLPPERLKPLLDSRASSQPDGMGIGLPVSSTTVEAHGGKITAANAKTGVATLRDPKQEERP